ncbi:MAG: hypothetical protein V7700_01680 [Halioglobus sp.]
MTRLLLILTLSVTAASASAADWPWKGYTSLERPYYCKGFVVEGLASMQAEGASRVRLWEAWNYVIRSTAADQTPVPDEYLAGREQFSTLLASSDVPTILADADGSCGLGRSGHQITGW